MPGGPGGLPSAPASLAATEYKEPQRRHTSQLKATTQGANVHCAHEFL